MHTGQVAFLQEIKKAIADQVAVKKDDDEQIIESESASSRSEKTEEEEFSEEEIERRIVAQVLAAASAQKGSKITAAERVPASVAPTRASTRAGPTST